MANVKEIGGKAFQLIKLKEQGINVPDFFVIPTHVLRNQLDINQPLESIVTQLDEVVVPPIILDEVKAFANKVGKESTFAVRSSGAEEDGSQFSFAGQYDSFLNVSSVHLANKILEVWRSNYSPHIMAYRKQNKLPLNHDIAVIIQQMIPADVSGVAFGADPITGDENAHIISAVYGLGEGLVSQNFPADTYTLRYENTGELVGIESDIVTKVEAIRPNRGDECGVSTKLVEEGLQHEDTLRKNQLIEISQQLFKLREYFGTPQDVEFCYFHNELFILQSRAITQTKGEYILWDNSNIIESYPGITTPLTFSFIIKMYEMVYRQFVQIMGVREQEVEKHKTVFEQTLGLVRGRVYYNLLSWYKMLAMLPGYAINAENMERMMGVKERFNLGDEFKMTKKLARWRILKMVFTMLAMHRKLPNERKRFVAKFNTILQEYKNIDFDEVNVPTLVKYYNDFESRVLLQWKAPLINDFFAMIWFGTLEKKAKLWIPEHINIHNDLLCGSGDIISVEPIHQSIKLADLVNSTPHFKDLFLNSTPKSIWGDLCNEPQYNQLYKAVKKYLNSYGDRCVGELKLETIAYQQDPTLFIAMLKTYVVNGITTENTSNTTDKQNRTLAQKKILKEFKNKPLKKWLFNYILSKTRTLVSNRENLRYERTRGFGMVRSMFVSLGKKLHQQGFLNNERDIFYMELSEIKALEKQTFPESLGGEIEKRKQEFGEYQKQEIPKERFFTYGNNFTDTYIFSPEKVEESLKELQGVGCSPGIVKRKVRVVHHPSEIDSLEGDILVTHSTDPGWVTLFPSASAIVVERGSVLSHSAIVSREMGIPCIVGVSGLLRSLRTGDVVWMNGATGEIKLVENG